MTNARWQRWLVGAHLLLIVGWAAGWWERSPALALAGAFAVPLMFRLGMAPQFLLMAWVSHGDPAPRPGTAALLRAWWAETRWAALVFGWWQPFRHQAVPDWLPSAPTGRRGVVLVHGFLCNRGFWTPWLPLLRARGHAFVAVTLEPAWGSIDGYAPVVEAAVRRVEQATGLAPVVIGHSMGGLAARAWLCAVPGALARVHRVITLGTPHGGTWAARGARSVNGRQMRPDSPWLRALRAEEPAGAAARCVCWYSNCDNVVYPPAAAMLPGADNRYIAGVAHVEMAFRSEVVSACLELLEL